MSQSDFRPPVDIPAAIRRIVALEALRRARRRIALGLALIPLSCWFAVTRYRPDFSWSPAEVAMVTPALAVAAGLIILGVWRYPRREDAA